MKNNCVLIYNEQIPNYAKRFFKFKIGKISIQNYTVSDIYNGFLSNHDICTDALLLDFLPLLKYANRF